MSKPPHPTADDNPTIVIAETKGARREVICPECGTSATITINRREAEDFCRRCDFPLFWTPAAIVLDTSSGPASDALRRLPGTAGRVTVGKLDCPHCRESNPVTETHCLRCQGDLHPVFAAPPAPPVLAPPPDPEPEPDPVQRTPWWVWAGIALTLVLAIALIVYLIQR
ncbi:hypothetical protein [Nocardioides sp. W7]|uniref:hypothetical protein n=1 Tax=Nocardioides sp. W7 TaxID=2931390 RepID=UPI001FD48D72|nr:hypothetical protein [Nocardioides sp. W7]